MISLKEQLEWCIETQTALKFFGQQCESAAENVDKTIQELQANIFEEGYQPIMNVFPEFQKATRELYEDIKTVHQPYIQEQINGLMETIQQLKSI